MTLILLKIRRQKKFTELSYIDVLNQGLGVMDSTAASLCMDNNIPLLVFGISTSGNIKRAVMGECIGTTIGREFDVTESDRE